jgi:hypothetical protein
MQRAGMTDTDDDQRHTIPERTLAELVCYFDSPKIRRELEAFRIKFESDQGETDLTRRWATTLPPKDQEWLMTHHPDRYWRSMPPFVQAYVKQKMIGRHKEGKLDDMPAGFLRLYLTGQMKIQCGHDGWSR